MAFIDEVLEGYFLRLGKVEAYARAYWAFLKNEGPYPEPSKFGITDDKASGNTHKAGVSDLSIGPAATRCRSVDHGHTQNAVGSPP